MNLSLNRRGALLGLGAAFTLGRFSLAVAAAPTEKRFVVVLLRGAMDGLSVVTPYGDPALSGLRAPLVLGAPGTEGGMLDLGGFWGLHPQLAAVHQMYGQGAFLPVHAVAGSYRSRSHFEAQDYLESGVEQRLDSGWLNRVVQAMPADGQGLGLTVGLTAPLILRGPARARSWAPEHFRQPDPGFYARLAAITAPDPVLGPALREGLAARGFDAQALAGMGTTGATPALGKPENQFTVLCGAAGRLLAAPDGPRIAALEIDGWDTHTGQLKRLELQLKQLDDGMAALQTSLGPAWANTAVLAVTEFGRTVRSDGTSGTDHGTGTVALLMGGAVAGGRVRADWPGLGAGKLYEDRDLQPTADLRSVAKGVLADHLRLPAASFAAIFPGSEAVSPMRGLIAVG